MKFILFVFLLTVHYYSFGQVKINGQVSGFGEIKTCEVFFPIGKFHNATVSNTIPIKSDSTFSLNLDVKFNAIIEIRVATSLVYLYVEPGNDIYFKLQNTDDKNKSLQIKGENAAGSYWYNLYNFIPASNFPKQDFVADEITRKNVNEVLTHIKLFLNKETEPIDSLRQKNLITDSFAEIAKKDVYALHMRHLVITLTNMYDPKNPGLNNKIKQLKSLIYQTYPPVDPIYTSSKFGAAYIESGYLKQLAARDPSAGKKYTNESFGAYNEYLYSPLIFQEYLLGRALLLQKALSVNEFDFKKAYDSFKAKFPASSYAPVIDNLLKKEMINNADTLVRFDTVANYTTIKDLVKQYKGHNVLIDLWATWCIPCKLEFPYYKSIKEELKTYDVIPLFVSIDEPILKNLWKQTALQYDLQGHHQLANKALQADIKDLVYKNEALSIPRYILINKKSEVININAPRPSDKNMLIKEFVEKL